MKKLLVLFTGRVRVNNSFVKFLEIDLRDIFFVTSGTYSEVKCFISKQQIKVLVNGTNIKDFDLVYFRRMGDGLQSLVYGLGIYLKSNNIPIIPKYYGDYVIFRDKLLMLFKLALGGINIPESYYCDMGKIEENIEDVKKLGFPCIAKLAKSERMMGVFVIKNQEDIKKLLAATGGVPVIFQRLIKNKIEYRVLVIDGKTSVVFERVKRKYDGFKMDYEDQHGHEKYIDVKEIPDEIKKVSEASSKLLGLDISGVDILIEDGTNKVWVLEVNRSPGLGENPQKNPEMAAMSNYLKSTFS